MSTDNGGQRLATLLAEYQELEQKLADPGIHADQALARKTGRRFAEQTVLGAAHAFQRATDWHERRPPVA